MNVNIFGLIFHRMQGDNLLISDVFGLLNAFKRFFYFSFYQVYRQQLKEMEEIRREALLEIPDDLNLNISGLSNECREVIMQAKPGNVSFV